MKITLTWYKALDFFNVCFEQKFECTEKICTLFSYIQLDLNSNIYYIGPENYNSEKAEQAHRHSERQIKNVDSSQTLPDCFNTTYQYKKFYRFTGIDICMSLCICLIQSMIRDLEVSAFSECLLSSFIII